jgi:hypothetical protein
MMPRAVRGGGHTIQHGKHGGAFYLSPTGAKVYVGKGH